MYQISPYGYCIPSPDTEDKKMNRKIQTEFLQNIEDLLSGRCEIKTDQMDICKQLVHEGADPNYFDRNNMSPLCLAIRYCDIDVTKLLLQLGASVTMPSSDAKLTPLFECLLHCFRACLSSKDHPNLILLQLVLNSKNDTKTEIQDVLFKSLERLCCYEYFKMRRQPIFRVVFNNCKNITVLSNSNKSIFIKMISHLLVNNDLEGCKILLDLWHISQNDIAQIFIRDKRLFSSYSNYAIAKGDNFLNFKDLNMSSTCFSYSRSIKEKYEEFYCWLGKYFQLESLEVLCRRTIHEYLNAKPSIAVWNLHLPQLLQHFLLWSNIFDLDV